MGSTLGSMMGSTFGMVGGLIGNGATQGTRDAADALNAQQLSGIEGISVPDLTQAIINSQYTSAGDINPTLQQVDKMDSSAMGNLKEDPTGRKAQMAALQQLAALGSSGLGAQDKAQLNQQKQKSSQDFQNQQNQIQSAMAQRGASGSGANLLAQLNAARDVNFAQAANNGEIGNQANTRALQAILGSGNLAGDVRGTDFNVDYNKANAQDEMNQFNIQNQNSANLNNASIQNQAQNYNLQNKQKLANMNTQQANQELLRQTNAQQQNFNNQFAKQTGLASALQSRAKQFNAQADREAGQWANTFNQLGDVGSQMGGMFGGGKIKSKDGGISAGESYLDTSVIG